MESIGDVLKRIRPPAQPRESVQVSPETACPKCHGAGYLRIEVPIEDPRFGEMIACECTVREATARRRQVLLERSNLGPLRGKTFENFVIDRRVRPQRNSAEAAFRSAEMFARQEDRTEEQRLTNLQIEWLVLIGNHGTGKTHLAAAIANHRVQGGREAIFIVVPDLLDRLRASFSPNSDVSYDELFESARETDLLVLDDLGAQSSTAWAQEKLYQIINERYNRRLPTVITSNLSLDSMELRLRSRIGDKSLADVALIQGSDIRLGIEHQPDQAPKGGSPRTRR